MNGISTFTSDKENLQEILKLISKGGYQLPEFQRGWVWDDEHIINLLASVSLSYPIGAVMMLENGNLDVRFKPRPIEGVELSEGIEPDRFILDGQQRLTSLYQALCLKGAVKTRDARKKEIKRWYYIDMNAALDLNIDRIDAILSIPEDKQTRNFRNEIIKDYSTLEAEFKEMIFPISLTFECSDWRAKFNKYWKYDQAKIKLFDEFEKNIIKLIEQYQIPVIKLLKNTPKVAVCQVFEKVNTGGVSLTVFELVTASFAVDGYNLREDWEGKIDARGRKVSNGRRDKLHEHRVLRSVGADEFLQVITLLKTYNCKLVDQEVAVSCKRSDILKLTIDDFNMYANQSIRGFIAGAKFLFQQKIFINRDLPYTTQIVPLAAIFALLDEIDQNDETRNKIARWYWCGVFGELYGSATETRFAKDLFEVLEWIKNGASEPSTINDCNFVPSRLDTLRSRNSAAYKGIFNFFLRDKCFDFRTGIPIEVNSYFEDRIDIHHIFPKSWCQKKSINAKVYDSIVNKTALSYQTNRIIGGNAPSIYLKKLRDQEHISENRQKEILSSHAIDIESIYMDNFDSFFRLRKEALLQHIENATGKNITRQNLMDDDLYNKEDENSIQD